MKNLCMAAAAVVLSAAQAMAMDTESPAFSGEGMTEAQRQALREEIRAYLLDDPEVIMEAIARLEVRRAEQDRLAQRDLVRNNADALFADASSWSGGNPEGDVVVVEFIDYRCGFCRRAHPEVRELVASDAGIRYVIKEFPILGDMSVLASSFALAVRQVMGDDAYSRTHDSLMTMRGDVTPDSLAALSDGLGHDTEAVMAAMEGEGIQETVASNHALARTLGIDGTPGFVFGDRIVHGYVPLEGMRGIVADLRAENG